MDSKKLEALATAVEQGSFTRAAEILGYTQSGMTHMMNALEKDIGFPVLVRGRSGVTLTAAGEKIYPQVRACLDASRDLEREIRLVKTQKEDTIRVAAYASIALHWLPEVIEQFHAQHRDIHVDIKMGSVEEVYRWVMEDKVDLALASRQDFGPMDWIPLRDDPLLAILPRDFDLKGASVFDMRLFQDREFLMPALGFDLDITRALERCNVTPLVQLMEVSDSVVISMVSHGLGVSMLSELVLKGRRDDVQAVPLDPPAVRELGIVTRSKKQIRPAARQFMNIACEMIQML